MGIAQFQEGGEREMLWLEASFSIQWREKYSPDMFYYIKVYCLFYKTYDMQHNRHSKFIICRKSLFMPSLLAMA